MKISDRKKSKRKKRSVEKTKKKQELTVIKPNNLTIKGGASRGKTTGVKKNEKWGGWQEYGKENRRKTKVMQRKNLVPSNFSA